MNRTRLLLVALATGLAAPAYALEIDPNVIPEINLGGRGIVTVNTGEAKDALGETRSDTELDIADTSLLFGFSKYLFNDTDYGFAVFGFKLPEDDTDLRDDLYVHEAHVGVGGPRYEVKLGRSRLGNTLVQFPTIRDDDLLAYTHVGNTLSNAEAEEYQIFGNVVQGTWWWTPVMQLDVGSTARTETDAAGERETSADFNGFYGGLAYNVPEAIKFDRGVRYAGLRVDTQKAQSLGAGLLGDRATAVIAGLVYNLNSNPEDAWALDAQAIANDGVEVGDLSEHAARARAKSNAFVAALRYAHRPVLQTRWQAALVVGWKDYRDFDDATALAIAPTYAYRLGSGIDFVAQYIYEKNDGALRDATGVDKEQTLALGLRFGFDHTFNETVGERGAILNLEHNMLDSGPMGGGH